MRPERAELAALAAVTLRHGTWNEPQALTSDDLNKYYPSAILNPTVTGPQLSLRLPIFSSKSTESADKSMKSVHFLIGISTISAPF